MFDFQNGDRVVTFSDGAQKKGRVASVNPKLGRVAVSFEKNGAPVTFLAAHVFPLYRYVGKGKIMILAAAVK